jgi:hypothetical protein
MTSELILLAVVTWATLTTLGCILYRMERNWWREEAESNQDEAIRWERRVAEWEGAGDERG